MRILFFSFLLLATPIVAQDTTFPWQDFSFGTPALSLRMPGKPVAQASKLPDQLLQRIKRYEAHYINDRVNGMVVTIMHATYTDDVIADREGVINGTMEQWHRTGAVATVHSTKEITVSGKSALEQQGDYRHEGKDYAFYDLVIADGPSMWQVIVIIRVGDVGLRQALNDMRDSIQFKS